MNRISASALASTVVIVIGIGASTSGDVRAQSLLAPNGGPAYYGPFGEPPLEIKDTAVTGSTAMPTGERADASIAIQTAFGEQPTAIKATAVMGGAAMPTAEPFESNFPASRTAE